MSPTVFKEGPYRFYFTFREETRMNVHVHGPNGEAEFCLEPAIYLARNYGLTIREVNVGARRKLPGRHYYFDFDRWRWIPQLADPAKM